MDDGWIKLYRKIQDWEWFDDSHMVHLFIYFLINANTKERNWRGISDYWNLRKDNSYLLREVSEKRRNSREIDQPIYTYNYLKL